MDTYNPATGQLLQQYSSLGEQAVDLALEAAHVQFHAWRMTPLSERCDRMLALASLLASQECQIATLMTREMGKPLLQSRAEVKKCGRLCQYQVDHIADWLKPEVVQTEFEYSAIHFEPLGVLLAIMPWNYPLWQVFRFAVSQVLAGNVMVLKHAPNVTGCALKIASLFEEAGFPEGVFTTLVVEVGQVEAIIHDTRVKGVTLTGSAAAGKIVGSQAGAALKKVSLELGGSDPYVILSDADIEQAAKVSVDARMSNAGQICIAPKRCIVLADVYDQWLQCVINQLKQYDCGNPLEESTRLGPLAREDLRQHLHQQVLRSIECGAQLVVGGELPVGEGFFYPPTLLTQVVPGMPAFDDELFGPVISVVRVESEEEAVAMANQSIYGLGAAIFTSDTAVGRQIAISQVEAGSCYVNAAVASDPRFPIGGMKSSGIGRELSEAGLKEFMNAKVVCVR